MTEFLRAFDQWLDFNPQNILWAGIWLIGAAFAIWNAHDEWIEWQAHIRLKRAFDRTAAARWYFRQDAVKAVGFGCVAAAGMAAMLYQPLWARNLLFAGGIIFTSNQIMNRFERQYVMKLGDAQERKELQS